MAHYLNSYTVRRDEEQGLRTITETLPPGDLRTALLDLLEGIRTPVGMVLLHGWDYEDDEGDPEGVAV